MVDQPTVDPLIITEPLPKHCGWPWSKPSFSGGCGCGKAFTQHAEVFRCADCGIAMHRRCLVEHFADGKEHDLGSGYGKVRSPHPMGHHFALQIAWLVEEITTRDAKIAQLKDEAIAYKTPQDGNDMTFGRNPFGEGLVQAAIGQPANNPYHDGTLNWVEWHRGFQHWQTAPRFNLSTLTSTP